MSNNPKAGREFTHKVITNADGVPTEVEIVEIVHGGLPTAGSSAVYDNIKSSNGVNVKRESGWYRVLVSMHGAHELAEYCKLTDAWSVKGTKHEFVDSQFYLIDPKIVMTPSGELVYHKSEHDPLYNTQQEG